MYLHTILLSAANISISIASMTDHPPCLHHCYEKRYCSPSSQAYHPYQITKSSSSPSNQAHHSYLISYRSYLPPSSQALRRLQIMLWTKSAQTTSPGAVSCGDSDDYDLIMFIHVNFSDNLVVNLERKVWRKNFVSAPTSSLGLCPTIPTTTQITGSLIKSFLQITKDFMTIGQWSLTSIKTHFRRSMITTTTHHNH